jgi:hypothetical protein
VTWSPILTCMSWGTTAPINCDRLSRLTSTRTFGMYAGSINPLIFLCVRCIDTRPCSLVRMPTILPVSVCPSVSLPRTLHSDSADAKAETACPTKTAARISQIAGNAAFGNLSMGVERVTRIAHLPPISGSPVLKIVIATTPIAGSSKGRKLIDRRTAQDRKRKTAKFSTSTGRRLL